MPYLLWTIKRDVVDYHSLSCDQMLNHYGKTASFTTKVGGREGLGLSLSGWAIYSWESHREAPPQDTHHFLSHMHAHLPPTRSPHPPTVSFSNMGPQ